MIILGKPHNLSEYYTVSNKWYYDRLCERGVIPLFREGNVFYFGKGQFDFWLAKAGVMDKIYFGMFVRKGG